MYFPSNNQVWVIPLSKWVKQKQNYFLRLVLLQASSKYDALDGKSLSLASQNFISYCNYVRLNFLKTLPWNFTYCWESVKQNPLTQLQNPLKWHLFYETCIELRAQSNEECYLKLTDCESLVTC